VNKIVIKKSSYPTLDQVVKMLKEDRDATIVIDGYTDNTGSDAYNKALSAKRAGVVRSYLLKHGVKARQTKTHANGSKSPAAPNTTTEGRAQNRRVEIKVK
jgi:outer membrane protein OmpA-like peptidoglycan-associated protein